MNKDRIPPAGEPVSDAVQQLALSIHNGLQGELGASGDLDGVMQAAQESYPAFLFGSLALHLAGTNLDSAATAEERTAAIKDALHRITTTPTLYEQVTGARPGSGLAKIEGAFDTEAERKEAEDAAELRAQVSKFGYLSRSMLDKSGRSIRLDYITTEPITHGMRRKRNALPVGQLITVKMAPMIVNWEPVRQYKQAYPVYNNGTLLGYNYRSEDYIGQREIKSTPVFDVTAITPSESLPPKVRELIGRSVSIGHISTGSQLVFSHSYSMNARETVGVSDTNPHTTDRLKLPAVLRQVYLGGSTAHPLFAN